MKCDLPTTIKIASSLEAGLYSEKNRSRANGLYTFAIANSTSEQFDLHKLPFTEEIMGRMTEVSDPEDRGLENLEIQGLKLREDGGVLILAEESRRYERTTGGQSFQMGPGGGRFIVDYYYEDLLATSIGPQGQIDWQEVLPKKQVSQDDDGLFSSCFVMTAPDRLRMLYNDEIAYETTISAYQVDWQGRIERNSVMSTEYQKLKLIFRESLQTGVNEVLVPSERSGKVKLVRILF